MDETRYTGGENAGGGRKMVYLMFLAHVLGDYLFQSDAIARWKARSIAGVLAHGGIVTVTTLMCAALVVPSWWPYALLIGLAHTVIDLVRARFLRTANPAWELIWYLLDQLAHLAVIVLIVAWSDAPSRSELTGVAALLADPQALGYAVCYLLLLNPAWVLLRFTVRGVWGADAAPHLGEGEKYGPMVERVLIASCVLAGHFLPVPLVLLPRRLVPFRVRGMGVGVLVRPIGHWAETAMSVLLAVAVGLALRVVRG
jgi:hypothetical protein